MGLLRCFVDASGGELAMGAGRGALMAGGALTVGALAHGITVSVRPNASRADELARGAGRAIFTGRRAEVVAVGAGGALDSKGGGSAVAAEDSVVASDSGTLRARTIVQNPSASTRTSPNAAHPSQRRLWEGLLGGGRMVGMGVSDVGREGSSRGGFGAGGITSLTSG